ncbi:MAG: glycosyltransferase [Brachybacterium sp.]
MIHDDEVRTDEELELLRAREAAADPVALLRKYEGLQARDRHHRRRIQELEKRLQKADEERRSLEGAVRWQKAKRAEAEDARRTERSHASTAAQDLTRRLREAHGKLDAYKREYHRLRDDLQRVRGSRSYRIGRAVLSPASLFRSSPKPVLELDPASALKAEPPQALESTDAGAVPPALTEAQSTVIERSAVTEVIPAGAQSAPALPREASVVSSSAEATPAFRLPGFSGESPLPVAERDLHTLRLEFRMHPDPATFYRVLNRSWYAHGMIDEPARLILEHPDFVDALTAAQKPLVDRVLGDYRLRHQTPTIPARAEGMAFLAEPDRVMYCVHSTPVFNSNGYSTRTRGVANGFREADVDVRVVARAGYPWDHRTDVPKPAIARTVRRLDDVDYVHLPGSGLGRVPLDHYLIEAADAFTREALLQRPEVIQSASNYRTALPALIAARRLGVPFVYEVRGFWEMSQAAAVPGWDRSEQFRTIAALETLVAEEADHVLAITRQVKDDLVARGIPGAKISIAPNAVDVDEFAPLPKDVVFAAAQKIRTDVPVIGFAGSMVSYEGLATLLEASALLTERGTDHQVVLAGSGPEEVSLRALRDRRGLQNVTFLGRLPMTDMPRLLSTFDIVPLPRLSLPVTEMVSPLKPLEAFAAMKAVLFSDVAPHRDLAGAHQERGTLFAAGDPESLAVQLQALIADADLRRDLGRAARLWTLDKRSWPRIARAMRATHAVASEHFTDHVAPDALALSGVTVGLIADEFTTKTLSASLDTVILDRSGWQQQLETTPVDIVIVESAWEGNGGQWHRGVGAYAPHEHRDIRDLLAFCRDRGIPTAFWNKEDPVHIKRFRPTAALCDHVFTTDGAMIPRYLSTPGALTSTASSMPFYAQPLIHNPLPTDREYRHTVAYAGTYYGDRYKERSTELYRMLEAASAFGLTIYDRQAALPDSPYRFPPEFARFSEGTLPYEQVIDSYKAHLAHLNVNSVAGSPTMFSRRVVEIAACGGIALSGPGRGVEETFGGMIPVSKDLSIWRALLHDWSTDPTARVREAWRQLRAVHRSRTVHSAMTVMLRTAGIPVRAPQLDDYAVVLTQPTSELVDSVLAQSRRPREVFVPGGPSDLTDPLRTAGIVVRDSAEAHRAESHWIGLVEHAVHRTWFEDLLLATRFGSWDRIDAEIAQADSVGRTLASYGAREGSTAGLVLSSRARHGATVDEALRSPTDSAVRLLVAPARAADTTLGRRPALAGTDTDQGPRTVLVAGHDLKFAGALLQALEDQGHDVLIDQWENHTKHDEARSLELLARADTVFCEWGMGNAVWYSKHVQPRQRLVVRVHLQELDRPYLRRTDHANVDAYVFVGELVRRAAVESHGVPAERALVVPNFVDVDALALPKKDDARFHLGFVGMVPQRKRLDLAVDLVEHLVREDSRYRLFVKGKRPEDFPWMQNRPEEMSYYDALARRIDALNAEFPGVVTFDAHGNDMPEWFRKIGVALSVSDFESFHFSVADGAASGALPASLAWAGSDYLYPREWLFASVEEMAESIQERLDESRDYSALIRMRYDGSVVLPQLLGLVIPTLR